MLPEGRAYSCHFVRPTVRPSVTLSIRPSVRANIEGLGAILDMIMVYFDVYSVYNALGSP